MRILTNHKVNPANDALTVEAVDRPGSGGAHHSYLITGPNDWCYAELVFQNGPINEVGVNGITHETLLAILEDRLEAFQAGAYACPENGAALEAVRLAQYWLQERTKSRMARNVEGTHAV